MLTPFVSHRSSRFQTLCPAAINVPQKYASFVEELKKFRLRRGSLELHLALLSRNGANMWSITDVGWMKGRVQALCEGWWNRSDISSEVKKGNPCRHRLRRRDEGGGQEWREVRPLRGNVILLSSAPYTHTRTHTRILCQCAGWCTHAKKGWVPEE